MKEKFLHIAKYLDKKLNVVPLLFGSLGLEQRLGTYLNADDIDVLIPEIFLYDRWDSIVRIMEENGYALYDAHEHAFEENGVRYLLLDLWDYLKVYTASLKDGYRKNVKNKNDQQKIDLINQALSEED